MVAPNQPAPKSEVSPAELIPLEDVPPLLPRDIDGRVNRCTVYRWAQRGRRGVVLRTVRRDGVRCTCRAWIRDFYRERGWGEVVLADEIPTAPVQPRAVSVAMVNRERRSLERELQEDGWK